MAGTSPIVHRRRLGATLRALREARGLTGEQAGHAVERSASWISRVEGGRMGVRARDIRDLLDLYGITDKNQREDLLRLAIESRTQGWWSRYSSTIPEVYSTFIGLESEASRLDLYESVAVTGVLQTEEYARHVISGGLLALDRHGVEDRVKIRMRRQEILSRENPPQLSVIFPESVLTQTVGSHAVMQQQLHHIIDIAGRPKVNIRILLNTDVPPITSIANFVMMYFSTPEPEVVYVEDFTGGKLEEGRAVRAFQEVFSRFTSHALTKQQSLARIQQAIADHEESSGSHR